MLMRRDYNGEDICLANLRYVHRLGIGNGGHSRHASNPFTWTFAKLLPSYGSKGITWDLMIAVPWLDTLWLHI